MSKRTIESPAFLVVSTVRRQASRLVSWRTLNSALVSVLFAVIESLLRFDERDFARFYEELGGSHWMGSGESFYAAAVASGNTSACQSFEAFSSRAPYILDNGNRVAELSEVEWSGLKCVVSSFGDGCIRLAHYREMSCDSVDRGDRYVHLHRGVGKPLKRFSVSVEDWRCEMSARRKAKRTAKVSESASQEGGA